VLEYYAGKFYAISPYLEEIGELEVIEFGEIQKLKVFPHPFLTPVSYFERREHYRHHMYDGIMVFFEGNEYRSKWSPTAEIQLGNQVWEVALYDELWPVRHRPGKSPLAPVAALSTIQSCLRAAYLVPFFSGLEQELPSFLHEVAHKPKAINLGAKAFYLLDDKRVAFIRERGKRLDCIGGGIHEGEKPIEAMVRETFEETDVVIPQERFVYLGVTETEGDSGLWRSFVYLAKAPEEMMWKTTVEVYDIANIQNWNRSDKGRPRQVWMARHLDMFSERFETISGAWQFLVEKMKKVDNYEGPNLVEAAWGQAGMSSSSELTKKHQDLVVSTASSKEQLKGTYGVPLVYSLDHDGKSGISVKFFSFPEDREGASKLIGDIFGADVSIPAAEYYLRISKLPIAGNVRPSRRSSQIFVKKCVTYGILEERLVPNSGGGREFVRKG